MKQIFFLILCFFSTVTVLGQSAFPQGFESVTNPKGEYFIDDANFAPVTLMDNPLKTGINTSDKVAAVMVGINSGIIKLNFADGVTPKFTYPAHPQGLDELYYDVLRFKYYSAGTLNKNVEFEPNGSATSPKTIVQPGPYYNEEWAYVTLSLVNKSYSNFQIRVNRNEAGNGPATGTVADTYVYIDDFELYNSAVGPISAVPLVLNDLLFSCKNKGNQNFALEASFDKTSNVRIDLISMEGRLVNIYNQVVIGNLSVPFTTPAKGIYCVRMLVDNQYSKTEKIIAQ